MNKYVKILSLILASCILFCGCKDKKEVVEEPTDTVSELNYNELSKKQLEVLALENDGEAAFYLGRIYDYGLEEESKNASEAFRWYQVSSDAGFPYGSLYLGYCYLNGAGVEKNTETAGELFQNALDNDVKEGLVGLARCIILNNDEERFSEAREYIEEAYNLNLLDGFYYMGYVHEKGIDTEVNVEKAVECYEKAASYESDDVGDQFAINSANTRLGYLYANGLLGEVDGKTALSYLKKAADNGFLEAKYYIGIMYLSGIGIDKNPEKALSYFEEAAEEDYAPALSQIAYIYFNGKGVEPDYEQAVYYEKLAAAQGYAPSQINLGYLYENGFGVEKNLETALAYYKLAAESDFEGANEAITRVESLLSK